MFGAVVLMTLAPVLAPFAETFTSYEYFWLACLGLSCAAVVSRGSPLKGAIALLIGMLLSSVGMSDVHGQPRFLFGMDPLINGVNFIPAMIGLFGLSEVLKNACKPTHETYLDAIPPSATAEQEPLRGALAFWWKRKFQALRSSALGTVIGSIPGAGADIAAWVSLAISRRLKRSPPRATPSAQPPAPAGARPATQAQDPSKETDALEGLGDATAANNAAISGAWVPSLVFGIPGDSVTAIVLGVLLMKNIKPGPDIFAKQPVLVSSIYVSFIVANLLLIPVGYGAIRLSTQLIRIPKSVLLPLIVFFCALGAFAINSDPFDIGVLVVMGILGFILERFRIPLGPVVLGLVLGGKVELYFLQSMIAADGSLLSLVSRPIAAVLAASCLLLWCLPLFRRRNP